MHRFFAVKSGDLFMITGQDAAHLYKTLRIREGELIEALDGMGARALAEVISCEKALCTARYIEDLPPNEPLISVTLYQALPKADKLEFVIQKATELGLRAVHPVQTERCDVKISAERSDSRAERLSKIAQEAAKQCGRARPVQIYPAQSLRDMSEVLKAHSKLIIPYENGGTPLKEALSRADFSQIAYVIGPEGGFDPDEIDFLREAGGETVTLGPRILRTETAAVAVASAIMYEAGQWL